VALLRASGEHSGEDLDLNAINGALDQASGIAYDTILIDFAEAFALRDQARLAAARRTLGDTLGPAALVDAAGVVAVFDAVVKIADATGIPLEDAKAAATDDVRGDLGIDSFRDRVAD